MIDGKNYIDSRVSFYEVPKRKKVIADKKKVLIFGDVIIEPDNRWVEVNGVGIKLKGKSVDILLSLCGTYGTFIKSSVLFKKVWPDDTEQQPSTYVWMYLDNLKKIHSDFIISERNVGHKINPKYAHRTSL